MSPILSSSYDRSYTVNRQPISNSFESSWLKGFKCVNGEKQGSVVTRECGYELLVGERCGGDEGSDGGGGGDGFEGVDDVRDVAADLFEGGGDGVEIRFVGREGREVVEDNGWGGLGDGVNVRGGGRCLQRCGWDEDCD
ncbi:hypothetical protein NE237_023494 [Protea cynaroides]|uniref:Uncharacterized protein n=1 Tax=Protea cynaroides TaxID=273540 RepID=A0A9Q0HD15_9MAGN|nr:hypothetical protein NE237_023494 [Protea cynaroides]